MSCKHLVDGCCDHSHTPWAKDLLIAPSICAECPHYDGPSRGLGDLVHAVAKVTGVAAVARTVERVTGRPCGCAQRRAALNKLSTTQND
jgi:hypothetical protein